MVNFRAPGSNDLGGSFFRLVSQVLAKIETSWSISRAKVRRSARHPASPLPARRLQEPARPPTRAGFSLPDGGKVSGEAPRNRGGMGA